MNNTKCINKLKSQKFSEYAKTKIGMLQFSLTAKKKNPSWVTLDFRFYELIDCQNA